MGPDGDDDDEPKDTEMRETNREGAKQKDPI
jgi:hypothetical protein